MGDHQTSHRLTGREPETGGKPRPGDSRRGRLVFRPPRAGDTERDVPPGLVFRRADCNRRDGIWLRASFTNGSAPCSINSTTTFKFLLFDATCNGVLPLPSSRFTSAPTSSKHSTTSTASSCDAMCNGVQPLWFCTFGSAPPSSKSFTSWGVPRRDATCSGVECLLSSAFTSAPW